MNEIMNMIEAAGDTAVAANVTLAAGQEVWIEVCDLAVEGTKGGDL